MMLPAATIESFKLGCSPIHYEHAPSVASYQPAACRYCQKTANFTLQINKYEYMGCLAWGKQELGMFDSPPAMLQLGDFNYVCLMTGFLFHFLGNSQEFGTNGVLCELLLAFCKERTQLAFCSRIYRSFGIPLPGFLHNIMRSLKRYEKHFA